MKEAKAICLVISTILLSVIISGCSTPGTNPTNTAAPSSSPSTTAAPSINPTTNPTTNDAVVKIAGNTSGNIANWGFVAQQGEWIYYCNSDEKLYKVKTDGSSKTLIPISDDEPRYINVVNDWIFYLNVGQKNK